ncbi:MAG: histidine phosphatase family protein, partial [Planctomycetales bacterium]
DSDMTVMYLLRHGATDNNLANPPKLQGCNLNPGLSAEGRRQACAASVLLGNQAITAVYSSPLLRAVETAETVAHQHQLPVMKVDGIIEADVGNWEGRDWEEIQQSEPAAYHQFIADPASNAYSGGECFGEVAARVIPQFDRLLEQHMGDSIVVVGHNVVNRVYLAHLSGIPLFQSRQVSQSNCGINVIRRRRGQNQLLTANSIFHLERA